MIFFRRTDSVCFSFRSSLQNPNRLSLPPISLFGGSSRRASLFFSSFLCVLACRLCSHCAFSTPGFRCRIPLCWFRRYDDGFSHLSQFDFSRGAGHAEDVCHMLRNSLPHP